MAGSPRRKRLALWCQLGLDEGPCPVLGREVRLAQSGGELKSLSAISGALRRFRHSLLSRQGTWAETITADPHAWLARLRFRVRRSHRPAHRTNVMLYLVTNTVGSSVWFYRGAL